MPSGDTHLIVSLAVALALIKFTRLWAGLDAGIILVAVFAGNWVMDKDILIHRHRNPLVTHGILPITVMAVLIWWLSTANKLGIESIAPVGFAFGALSHLAADRIKDWLPLPNIGQLEDAVVKAAAIALLAVVLTA